MASMEDDQEGDRNLWQDMLSKSANSSWNSTKTANSTLVVVGDRVNGKTSVLNKFKDRVTDEKVSAEYILDYSYINAKNRFNLDKDEVISRMGVWQLDDHNHADLLAQLIRPKDLDTCVFVVTIDLSKPWSVLESLVKWLDVLKVTVGKIGGELAPEQQAALKTKISHAVQSYVDPGVSAAVVAEEAKVAEEVKPEDGATATSTSTSTSTAATATATEVKTESVPAAVEGAAAGAGETEDASAGVGAEVDISVPVVNLGVPVIILGTKADYFSRALAKVGADEKFDFVQQRVRKIALEYGAATIFTSAFGEGNNIGLCQDYIYHRALGLPNKHAAKVVGSAEDIAIFAPAGFDSLELINSGSTGT
jgi:dynein light intermediate chain 1